MILIFNFSHMSTYTQAWCLTLEISDALQVRIFKIIIGGWFKQKLPRPYLKQTALSYAESL
jgi:hypothetical protein